MHLRCVLHLCTPGILWVVFAGFTPVVAESPGGVLIGGPDPTAVAISRETPEGTKYDYYAVVTGRGIPILHSTDLRSWEPVGRVFPKAVPSWAAREVPGSTGIWAPDLSFHDGLYYLYYSVSTFGSQRSVIGLAVNKAIDPNDPDYRWIDRGKVIESLPGKCDYNAIDPNLVVADDGRWYLFFGSFWSGLKAIELDRTSGKPKADAPLVPVASRPNHPTHAIEGAYVIRRGEYYYLFASWDRCCDGANSDYKVVVGRSKNVLGPYVDAAGRRMLDGGGTVVLQGDRRWKGPGHNGIVHTREGWWMIHHTYDVRHLDRHRILQVRPMRWTENGWPLVGDPLVE
ncbi:arabinan endo-1,5-alpha-L-arabinosidase [Thermostilla marina]